MIGVQAIRTSPYHPQTDGLLERFNGTLKSMLRRLPKVELVDWDRMLPYLLFAYREVPQESTGFSPFELLYGHQVRGPLDILKESWEEDRKSNESIVEYVFKMRERIAAMRKVAHENQVESQKRQKVYYDRCSSDRSFSEGDKVLVLLPSSNKKLAAEWQGPYVISRRTGPVNYEVDLQGKRKCRRIFHVNMLRAWHSPKQPTIEAMVVVTECEDDIPDLPVGASGQTQVSVDEQLTAEQKVELEGVLSRHLEVFQDQPGRTSMVEHTIDTGSARPVRQKPYRIPHSQERVVAEEIEKMMDSNIIEESQSDWASPIVLVPKADGTTRFCVDYRELNRVSKFDAYPMPRIEDVIDKLGPARYTSTLDLTRGYWQVPVAQDSVEKTAFVTPNGLYQFKCMPFGLHGAPPTFQRLVNKVLQDCQSFALAYLDDIIVFSASWREHLYHLEQVLKRLSKVGLTAKPAKCYLGMRHVRYLGYVVGDGRVQPTKDKVNAVQDSPRPITKKDVRSFLGLSGYYRRFISNYASITAPLSDLTKKGCPTIVEWTEECQEAFEGLKQALCSNPVLANPDYATRFILRTDASERGLGAELFQVVDGQRRTIAYLSRKLLPRERNYATIEKECLAIVWAIKSVHVYVHGQEFELETDHSPLVWLKTLKDKNNKLVRWSLFLQQYSFVVSPRAGKENVAADWLSRLD